MANKLYELFHPEVKLQNKRLSGNNPDCPVPAESYPRGHKLSEVIVEWNRRVNDETN